MIESFARAYWIDKIPSGLEIHIQVSFEYESLWSFKLDNLKVSYQEACKLLGIDPFYTDQLEDEIEMSHEYIDKYWVEDFPDFVEIHIQIPANYEKLWVTKLAELTATPGEVEEYTE